MLAVALLSVAMTSSPASASEPLSIRIVGNHFVDGSGRPVRLLGVNRSGSEYECVDGRGFFDGPSDGDSIAAMASWHINAVRVPLNEDCWLGINGAPAALSGAAYRDAITAYVQRLHDAGLYAIVDLHWSAPGTQPANADTGQGRKMADRDHAPDFWRSVATAFKDDPATVLDLYNEPHDISWDCWQNGCETSDANGSWETAGFQSLIDAVRGTSARNPILVAGLRWSGDLRGWPHGLHDPAQQMAASWHVYTPTSRLDALRDFVVRPIAASYPVVIAELGEKDCGHAWLDGFLNWADNLGISYLAWTWDTWPDCANPVLITSYQGTPTAYGVGFRDHLQALWRSQAAPRVLSPIEAFIPLIGAIVVVAALLVVLLFAAVFGVRRRRRRNPARTVIAM
jgi:hypothetical protein